MFFSTNTFFIKYRYLLTIIVSIIVGTMIWLCIPIRYSAQTTLADEYKEMDLLVGINELKIYQRGVQEVYHSGINSISVYGKALETTDYARAMGNIILPKGHTYADYIGAKDTIEDILDHIHYAAKEKNNTLKIEYWDTDPMVAYTMLNATIDYLNDLLTKKRQEQHTISINNESKKVAQLQTELIYATKCLNTYADTHLRINKPSIKDSLSILQRNVIIARERLRNAHVDLERAKLLLSKDSHHFHILKPNTVPTENATSIWGYILSSIILGVIIIRSIELFNKRRKEEHFRWRIHNIFSPWNITVLHWLLIILLILWGGDLLYPLTERFWISISIWVPTLAISSFITFHLTYRHTEFSLSSSLKKSTFTPNINIKWFYILLVISLIFTPICIKIAMDIVSQFSGENMMNNIRILVTEGEINWGYFAYCFVINQALFICAYWARKKLGIHMMVITTILMLMNAFALMNKSSLLFIFVIIAFVLYEKQIISLKSIFLTGGGLIALFFLLTLLRNFTDGDGEINSDDLSFIDFFAMYVLSPPVAYSYMPPDIGMKFGSRSLTLFYLVMGKLNGNFHVESIIQEFMEVPIPTNLYTIMQPFYLDFGQWGVFVFALLYGIASGWCYTLYKNGNSWGCVVYTYLIVNLISQYGSERILLSPIPNIQLLIILFLLTQTKFKISLFSNKHA